MKEEYISLSGARDYRLIIFSHPQLTSPKDFFGNIKPILSRGEKHSPVDFPFGAVENYVIDSTIFRVMRAKIRSKLQLWYPPTPENPHQPNPMDDFYDVETKEFLYPIYVGSYAPQPRAKTRKMPKHKFIPERYHILAVPFFSLFSSVDKVLKLGGSEITYYKVSLTELVKDLYQRKDEYPFFRITMYQGEPLDEPRIGQCRITTRNLVSKSATDESSTLGNIVDTKLFKYFQECGVIPSLCRIKFDDFDGHRLSLITDKFGNFNFYLRREGFNISFFTYFFDHFVQNGWLEATVTKPTLRAVEETSA